MRWIMQLPCKIIQGSVYERVTEVKALCMPGARLGSLALCSNPIAQISILGLHSGLLLVLNKSVISSVTVGKPFHLVILSPTLCLSCLFRL